MLSHLQRLFYTKDGDLDLGWLILLVAFTNGLLAFDLAAAGSWKITIAAWSWYGSVMSAAFIAGTTISRARLLATSKVMGEVATAIASSPTEPDLWHDDERGEHTEREAVE